ncbi:fructose-bisphosphatase [Candidatus Roizmanbacteria bacterium RIFCSPHIGHO2_12_FULL_44_10]|uniref:Fructose-1,6-bisphosphatase class 1 n=1 Tax=Candidatus Roizmanbacteria bacterium RIFCSPHIGHO2_12_FULL_44_10 TaxID=1802054 RepID=A0A1F7I599_9BACT|nr:MAG: fructose-bisphosphatase [Candidatus Roizmanbacteria bacterium RIFCSPHIGHO2_12_FULL_44_10]
MYQKVTTLTEYLLQEEQKFEKATGSFTLLMTTIENAAKIISSHIRRNGLVDLMGSTNKKNIFQEDVQKLDEFADITIAQSLEACGQVYAYSSEEMDQPKFLPKNHGEYVVFYDPLDGSNNIDVNINIGTIFSIYHKSKNLLIPGSNQVAAGYISYGPSVMFVYTSGSGVNGFTLDPSIGAFLLSHPNMKIPKSGNIYTINESYFPFYPEYLQRYLKYIKVKKNPYTLRYATVMVADVHRILCKGGIFLYPENSKAPKGKLRLLYEVNPMSFIMQQAQGSCFSMGKHPLSITPESFESRVPIALGSKEQIDEFAKYYDSRI